MVTNNPTKRKFLQFGALAVVAGILLATGGLIGNAMAGDDNEPAVIDSETDGTSDGSLSETNNTDNDSGSSSSISKGVPQAPSFGISNPAANGADTAKESAIASSGRYYSGCTGTLDGVILGSSIDPTAAGLDPQFLSSNFILQTLNLRAETDCEDAGVQYITLDTSWQTADGMFRIWLNQRQSDEPIASIAYDTWAEFWHDGYYLSVSVNQSYPTIMTLEGDGRGDDDRVDVAFEPGFAPNTKEVKAVLLDVIGELTGDASLQCFFQQVDGSWDTLTALGIDDPRGALPPGFSEQQIYARHFEAPSADCNVPEDVELPISFNASWSDGDDGWLSFSVWQLGQLNGAETSIGRSGEYGVSWSDGRFQYEIYGNRNNTGIGLDTLEAIAAAVDTGYAQSCRLNEREFSEAELKTVGIGWPQAPDGYKLTETSSSGTEKTTACGVDVKEGYFSANWSFESDDGAMLHASAWADGGGGRRGETGYIGTGYMGWPSAETVSYTLESWSDGRDGGSDQDAMIALAKSLDPAVDVDSFSDGPDKVSPPIDVPAQEDSTSSSSESNDSAAAK